VQLIGLRRRCHCTTNNIADNVAIAITIGGSVAIAIAITVTRHTRRSSSCNTTRGRHHLRGGWALCPSDEGGDHEQQRPEEKQIDVGSIVVKRRDGLRHEHGK